jgi:hypothetical protein
MNKTWLNKLPLACSVAPAALAVFRWQLGAVPDWLIGIMVFVDTIVAIMAAVSLDLAVISAVFTAVKTKWSYLTIVGVTVFNVLIGIDMYKVWDVGGYLHALFPIVTLFYAMHLASKPEEIMVEEVVEEVVGQVAYTPQVAEEVVEQVVEVKQPRRKSPVSVATMEMFS